MDFTILGLLNKKLFFIILIVFRFLNNYFFFMILIIFGLSIGGAQFTVRTIGAILFVVKIKITNILFYTGKLTIFFAANFRFFSCFCINFYFVFYGFHFNHPMFL